MLLTSIKVIITINVQRVYLIHILVK